MPYFRTDTHDQIPATTPRSVSSYLAKPVAVRSRASKNIMKMAIRTSSAAVIERDTLDRVCSPDIQGLDSENKTHPYHERIFSEHTDLNSVYAGSDSEPCSNKSQFGHKKQRTDPFALVYNAFAR